MDGPSTCTHCGAPLSTGRFCTNCGAPIDVPESEEPPRQAPPLFRDEVYPQPPPAPAPTPAPAPAPADPAYVEPVHAEPTAHRRSSGIGWWIAAVVGLLTVLVIGAALLFSGGGDDSPSASASPQTQKHHHASGAASSSGSSSPSPSASSSAASGSPTEVAGLSTATAPAHAPAGVDFTGQTVTYVAPNMVDGIDDTCWRTPGDATGMVLTFRLARPTEITRVGLINGYAKTAVSGGRTYDWYQGDRRVLAVTWIFDDGSSVDQQFQQTPTMQTRGVPPVTTSTVRVRITSVSPPGRGPAARNDTAISEVSLVGRAS